MNEWMWADELIEAYMWRYECDQNDLTVEEAKAVLTAVRQIQRLDAR